jgi:SRSO17 transposase
MGKVFKPKEKLKEGDKYKSKLEVYETHFWS